MSVTEGWKVPVAVYVVYMATIITAASALFGWSLEIPWWGWLCEWVVLVAGTYAWIKAESKPGDDGTLFLKKKTLITSAAIFAALFFIALAILWLL
ncbi:hypothetical protein C3E79_00760 [Corynebacterium liangguodongii]|uniref:Uncharacterized protein n=1 Tax=Corynebacterium liangguodongii TaxID=2079535 RepID=A0A2S0WBP6_9CORY|nr:hypothetical protein C3E79_00760 [Corynebacterium liangguodongii]PWB98786.1 hypothetical protein DF219_10220 [Corynebacterium liangguodongii]